ncbi:MAG: hypothetical protein NTU76_01595 [Candidatus Taylorbacteria bacterium]|nr:hypothetical protein [Candidatus Taylorbacteria bacterium]
MSKTKDSAFPEISRSDIKGDWIPFFKGMTPVKYKINLTGQAEEMDSLLQGNDRERGEPKVQIEYFFKITPDRFKFTLFLT